MHPPQFNMDIQAHLPPVLGAFHNFIQKHDPEDLAGYESIEDPQPGTHAEGPAAEGSLAEGILRMVERWLIRDKQQLHGICGFSTDELSQHGLV